ncbi:hypothetical protein MH117_20135 [Paenibacillus sp. ACRRX]|uniref:hypothetical protein n=1 Tax=Paenibacillus sp. ACRRX TaxID=2918206 RepID=UPI001EF650E0|nr:hypothetical protein [Paenibacillus sp. ACRRX]MCG7409719.1 hypothetical protein [Paenibacillus sp. ACRRX]
MKRILSVLALTLAFSTFSGAALAAASDSTGTVIKQTDAIELKQATPFYSTPGGKKLGSINPQQIGVLEASKDGNNVTWYKINTWKGIAWIKDPASLPQLKLVEVGNGTVFYKGTNGARLGTLSKQTLHVISQKTDKNGFTWYQVKTWKENSWVIAPDQAFKSVQLNKATALFNKPNGKKTATLQSQKVTVKYVEFDGNGKRWAKISTWNGDLWMKW